MRLVRDLLVFLAPTVLLSAVEASLETPEEISLKKEMKASKTSVSDSCTIRKLTRDLLEMNDDKLKEEFYPYAGRFVVALYPSFEPYFGSGEMKSLDTDDKKRDYVSAQLLEPDGIASLGNYLDSLITEKAKNEITEVDDLIAKTLNDNFGEAKKQFLLNKDHFGGLATEINKGSKADMKKALDYFKNNRLLFFSMFADADPKIIADLPEPIDNIGYYCMGFSVIFMITGAFLGHRLLKDSNQPFGDSESSSN